MIDALAEITAERENAKILLAAAEQRMMDFAREPEKFRLAKGERDAATEALERLDWAEKAEHERQTVAALEKKKAELATMQEQAMAAHHRARDIVSELGPVIAELVDRVHELGKLAATIERGTYFEGFAVREGYLERNTISPRLDLPSDHAITLLRCGREIARLSAMDVRAAELKAAQGRL